MNNTIHHVNSYRPTEVVSAPITSLQGETIVDSRLGHDLVHTGVYGVVTLTMGSGKVFVVNVDQSYGSIALKRSYPDNDAVARCEEEFVVAVEGGDKRTYAVSRENEALLGHDINLAEGMSYHDAQVLACRISALGPAYASTSVATRRSFRG